MRRILVLEPNDLIRENITKDIADLEIYHFRADRAETRIYDVIMYINNIGDTKILKDAQGHRKGNVIHANGVETAKIRLKPLLNPLTDEYNMADLRHSFKLNPKSMYGTFDHPVKIEKSTNDMIFVDHVYLLTDGRQKFIPPDERKKTQRDFLNG